MSPTPPDRPYQSYQDYAPPHPPQGSYAPPYAGYQYQPYYPGPMAPSTNPWAIASLICSVVGVSILGVIFGHIALSEIKRSNGWQEGHGMALAGLIIGYVEIGLGLLMVILFFGFVLSTPFPQH